MIIDTQDPHVQDAMAMLTRLVVMSWQKTDKRPAFAPLAIQAEHEPLAIGFVPQADPQYINHRRSER